MKFKQTGNDKQLNGIRIDACSIDDEPMSYIVWIQTKIFLSYQISEITSFSAQQYNCVEGSNVGRIPSRIVTRPVSVDPCPNPVDHSSAESAANVSCVPSTASLGPRK